MSIFTEMHDLRVFESVYAYREFLRKLALALEEGWIEEIPIAVKKPFSERERWFREPHSGEVYCLGPPGEKSSGSWRPVEPESLFPSKVITVVSQTKN